MGKAIATNKKAYRDYFLSQTIECGIALKGGEVKSLRAGEVAFRGAFARMEANEIYLHSLYIAPYEQASYMNDEPDRVRKLLLHKREIKKLIGAVAEKKMMLVPTKIYFNKRGVAKVELALGKGKKLYDKREAIKKRDVERSLERVIRTR